MLLVIGGILTITGGFVQQWYQNVYVTRHTSERTIRWMLSLDIERLLLIQQICDEVRQRKALQQSADEAASPVVSTIFRDLPDINALARYESLGGHSDDTRIRAVIGKLVTISAKIDAFNHFRNSIDKSAEQLKSGADKAHLSQIRPNYINDWKRISVLSVTIEDQSAYLASEIDNLVNGSSPRIQYPFELQFPAECMSYSTSITSFQFELSQDLIRKRGIDSVYVIFQSVDSVSVYVLEDGRRSLFKSMPRDSFK